MGTAGGLGFLPMTFLVFRTYGEKNSGNVAGILLGFFGLFSVFFIIIATYIVNPDNLMASVEYNMRNNIT